MTSKTAHSSMPSADLGILAPARKSGSPNESTRFASNQDLLRWLYADLTRISCVAAPDIVLHRFDRPSAPIHGVAAVQAHEDELVASTGGTLVMDVEHVVANSNFGTVMGVLRAWDESGRQEDVAFPFCGVWRFAGGRAVQHWENVAGDVGQVQGWFTRRRTREAKSNALEK